MTDRGTGRLVYSTGVGSICPGCGWPERDCKCSSQRTPAAAVPDRVVAKLRMEKKGRGGKIVTVVYDLPRNAAFLKVSARSSSALAAPAAPLTMARSSCRATSATASVST